MHIEQIIRIIAGSFILISVGLGMYVNTNWYYFTAFVGLNLLQSGFTNKCPMISLLKALGVKDCASKKTDE